jgi:hypothetical protein
MKNTNTFFIMILLLAAAVSANAQSWLLTGNAGTNPGTKFIGTTDNKALVFKTNNTERMRIQAGGQIGIKGNLNIDSGFALLMSNHRALVVDSIRGSTYLGNGIKINNNTYYNTASGWQALSNNVGYYNTANGAMALFANYSGSANTATGFQSLFSNSGSYNTANGYQALYNNSGAYNTANGYQALFFNSGTHNTASGIYALYSNGTGGNNVANGSYALYNNTTGGDNTSTGVYAMYENTSGIFNVVDGGSALFNNSTGSYNTAGGYGAIYNNTSGNYNTAVGYWALNQNFDASYNTALGTYAGASPHGWNNTFIGSETDVTSSDIYNGTALGNNVVITASNQVRIGNNFVTSIGGFANWTNISDGRVKKNIKENVPGLAFINKLKPVTYNLDMDAVDKIVQRPALKDKDGKSLALKTSRADMNARNAKQQIVYTGFVAQDVEKAAKEVNYDFSGVDAAKNDKDLYGLRYSEFVVPLVKAVQELSKQNDSLQKQNDAFEKRIEKLEAIMNMQSATTNDQPQITNISAASLDQNIPNPFSNTTIIRYTLPQEYTTAKIIIADRSGSVLKEMKISGAGKGNVQIDASTLAQGSYQYSLMVNGQLIGTKQMILTR